MQTHTFASIFAAALLCGCGTLGNKPPRATNLTGDWQLNESLSEDPLAQLREQRHSRGGGMRHGNWSGRSGAPHQRGAGSGGDFAARPEEIDIKQSAQELDLEADGSSTEFVYGEKVMASVQGGSAERASGWKGGEFVVKYKVIDGPTATRGYKLADGGRQLAVTTRVGGGRAPKLEYRTVYERKAAAG
jgi:hypothetical protein